MQNIKKKFTLEKKHILRYVSIVDFVMSLKVI